MGSEEAVKDEEARRETEDAHERCPNCGYGVRLKKAAPARRRRGSTQGDWVSVLMRALAIVLILIWLFDGMRKMYINLGPERRWIFYMVVIEGIVVMVGGGLFLFWGSGEED